MDVSYRASALARIQQRILFCGSVVPAYLTLDIGARLGVNNSAIDLDCLLFKLFDKGFMRSISLNHFVWSRITLLNTFRVEDFNDVVIGVATQIKSIGIFLRARSLNELGSVVFYVEFYSSQLNDVSSAELIILK